MHFVVDHLPTASVISFVDTQVSIARMKSIVVIMSFFDVLGFIYNACFIFNLKPSAFLIM